MTDNLTMYQKYAQPPQNALKPFNNGRFKGTDINPMWRIRVLTEEYGECGFGWYTNIDRMWMEDSPDTKERMVFCQVSLYVKRGGEWSAPIVGVGGNTFVAKCKSGLQASDEAYKMAYTDALGIACKELGIGADVWWKYEATKYTSQQEEQPFTDVSASTANPPLCSDCGKALEPYGDKTAQDMARITKTKFGRVLCNECAKAAKGAGAA